MPNVDRIRDWFQAGGAPVLMATIITSTIIYSRNIPIAPDQSYLQVFFWQLISWLPWTLIMPLAQAELMRGTTKPVSWAMTSLLVAFGCTLWFMLVSNHISPYLDRPDTMFGLFKWFLIFWFVISLLLFWAHLGHFLLKAGQTVPPDLLVKAEDDRRIAIWNNGTHIVVKSDQIIWVEAQNYYARIHLKGGKTYWVKMRLNQLMKELSGACFLRVHRGAIVNIEHLERIDRNPEGYWEAAMQGGRMVRVSRAGKQVLDDALNLIR